MWEHCDGRNNPADFISRGQGVQDLKQNETWWYGPHWLRKPEDQWPTTKNSLNSFDVVLEMCAEGELITNLSTNTVEEKIEELFDLAKYSSFQRVKRVTAWIFRFLNNTRTTTEKRGGSLTSEELIDAEKYWIKTIQRAEFRLERKQLLSGQRSNSQVKSTLKNLNVYINKEELMCVQTRLQEADLTALEIEPWILPSHHRFTELVIIACHERLYHAGLQQTMTQLRERYYIPKTRKTVKGIISKCLICRRKKAKPGNIIAAPLPRDRVVQSAPFEVTGLDYCGPLYVKKNGATEKAYVLLFTCAVTRAVHLELVDNMTTANFLLALRRFVSRRGMCKTVYSDNAKTFKKAERDLRAMWKILKTSALRDYFGSTGITWKYIVEKGSWWGGFYERMVQNVKNCLKKTLGKALLSNVEMETVLAEIEAVVNSRPLTFIYDCLDEPSPLTPTHFLIGRRLPSLPTHESK